MNPNILEPEPTLPPFSKSLPARRARVHTDRIVSATLVPLFRPHGAVSVHLPADERGNVQLADLFSRHNPLRRSRKRNHARHSPTDRRDQLLRLSHLCCGRT